MKMNKYLRRYKIETKIHSSIFTHRRHFVLEAGDFFFSFFFFYLKTKIPNMLVSVLLAAGRNVKLCLSFVRFVRPFCKEVGNLMSEVLNLKSEFSLFCCLETFFWNLYGLKLKSRYKSLAPEEPFHHYSSHLNSQSYELCKSGSNCCLLADHMHVNSDSCTKTHSKLLLWVIRQFGLMPLCLYAVTLCSIAINDRYINSKFVQRR